MCSYEKYSTFKVENRIIIIPLAHSVQRGALLSLSLSSFRRMTCCNVLWLQIVLEHAETQTHMPGPKNGRAHIKEFSSIFGPLSFAVPAFNCFGFINSSCEKNQRKKGNNFLIYALTNFGVQKTNPAAHWELSGQWAKTTAKTTRTVSGQCKISSKMQSRHKSFAQLWGVKG